VPTYSIDPGRSKIEVQARSSIHDTTAVWPKLTGTVEADAATLVESGATARVAADMTDFDAGDFLKNRKLRKDMELERFPEATFELTRLVGVTDKGDHQFDAVAEGTLRWHGREVAVRATGGGRVGDDRIEAVARFELDVRAVGVKAPRFLMFKVEDVVAVTVTLSATARS